VRRELWFGFGLMAVILLCVAVFTPWGNLTNGHLGLLMLALIVSAIMLGFPTAFTLMGMGVFFAWLAYLSVNPQLAVQQVLDLFVQRTYGVMANDVLIAVPLSCSWVIWSSARPSSTSCSAACTSPQRACRARSPLRRSLLPRYSPPPRGSWAPS